MQLIQDKDAPLPRKRNIIVVLRLIVFSVVYLIVIQEKSIKEVPPLLWMIFALFIASEIACLYEASSNIFVQRVLGWIFIFDTLLISLVIYYMGIKSTQLFIAYFAVIAVAAIARSAKAAFVITIIISVFYLFPQMHESNFRLTEALTRPIFFFGTAMFAGYLAEEVNTHHRAKLNIEQRFRNLLEHVKLLTIGLDLQGRIIYVNPFFLKLTGYAKDEAIGLNWFEIFTPPEQHYAARACFKDITNNRTEPHHEGVIITKDKHRLEISWNTTLILNQLGVPVGVMSIGQNITERKQAEDEKQRLFSQLVQSQKMEAIGSLAGGIAHDFNNLLAIIQGYTELAKAGLETENPSLDSLIQIENITDRAVKLTSQLLMFSRKESLNLSRLNTNLIIENITQMLARIVGKNITIKTELSGALSPVQANAGGIEQVIMNLVINARDAMPNGGNLFIRTENSIISRNAPKDSMDARPGQFICLSVEDTGQGMDQETLKHIFEPFFTTKPKSKGTGLGLAVVYGIVKQHDGWITVDSQPGKPARPDARLTEPRPNAGGGQAFGQDPGSRPDGHPFGRGSGGGTTFKIYLPATAALEDTTPAQINNVA